jgi:ribosomal protein S18 acetylase RimI-like enzyme
MCKISSGLGKSLTKNGNIISILHPKLEDANSIIEYLNIIGGESDNLSFGKNEFNISIAEQENYLNSINNDENSIMLIGSIDDEIVAIGQIMAKDKKRLAHNSELSISVKKDYWNEGIGTMLMAELLKFAISNEITKNIHLKVNTQNLNAIKLYEKFGFNKVGTIKNSINVNDTFYDELIMELNV